MAQNERRSAVLQMYKCTSMMEGNTLGHELLQHRVAARNLHNNIHPTDRPQPPTTSRMEEAMPQSSQAPDMWAEPAGLQ